MTASVPTRVSAGLVFLLAYGCGGSSPGGPFAPVPAHLVPAGTVIIVASAEDGRPVAGAAVSVGGRGYQTDSLGTMALTEPANLLSSVDVSAAGFLDRNTFLRRDDLRLTLWPRASALGLNEHITAELVYTSATLTCATSGVGSRSLVRVAPAVREFAVVLAPEYRQYENTVEAIRRAAAIASGLTDGRIRFGYSEDSQAAHRVDVRVDPGGAFPGAAAGVVTLVDSELNIVSARISFREAREFERNLPGYLFDFRRTTFLPMIAHELGHVVGLRHSPAPGLMSCSSAPTLWSYFHDHLDFAPLEKQVAHLIYQRRTGNAFPDREKSVALLAAREIGPVF